MDNARLKSFFVHVPKCAGTSALSFLNFMYGFDRSLLAIGEDEGENTLSVERFLRGNYRDFVDRFDFGAGHIPYTDIMAWSDGRAPRDLGLVTVLRDPLSRAISSYVYAQRSPDHPDHARMSAVSLDDILDGYEGSPQANYICQFVAGTTDFDTAARVLARDYVAFPPVQALPAFLSLFQKRVGGQLGNVGIRINITPGGTEGSAPDPAVMRRFLNANASDAALVDWATARWRDALLESLDRRVGAESSVFSLQAGRGGPEDTVARDAPIYLLQTPGAVARTVQHWVADYFAREAICAPPTIPDFRALGPLTLLRSRMIAGPLGWAPVELLRSLGQEPVVLTMLRDPSETSAALLAHAMATDPAHRLEDSWLGDGSLARAVREQGVEAVLASPLWADRFDNMQVRHLGFDGDKALAGVRPDKAALDHALAHLNGVAFFGLVEEPDWSAALFADRFQVPYRPLPSAGNGAKDAEAFKAAMIGAAGTNALDRALYEKARVLFAERVAVLAAKFGTDPADGPGALEGALLRQFQSQTGAPRLRQAVISQADPILTSGFQSPIHDPKSGWWVRWGGRTTRVYLPLDRSADRSIALELAYCLDQEIRDGLTFEIDGRPVPATKTFREAAPGYWTTVYAVTAPAAASSAGAYAELTILSPKSRRVSQDSGEAIEHAFALADITIA